MYFGASYTLTCVNLMKFGNYLKEHTFSEWRFYYIDYDRLKRQLRDRDPNGIIPERDEAAFVENLEKEMQKVSK